MRISLPLPPSYTPFAALGVRRNISICPQPTHIDSAVDPGTDKTWASCPDNSPEDVDDAVQSSQRAFTAYSKVNPRTRAQWLLKWHELILANRDDIATLITYETGKPLAESQGEITYATGFTWYARTGSDDFSSLNSSPSSSLIQFSNIPIGGLLAKQSVSKVRHFPLPSNLQLISLPLSTTTSLIPLRP